MATKPSALIDTRVIYCGDNLDQLRKFPAECVDLIYIDPPFNSNRNYEVFWGETKEKRSFEDRHASTQAYIEYMRPRSIELHRVLKKTGSFYYHCDWHASHYVKVMLDQIFGENQFVNEIIWKRQSAHSDAKQGSKHLGRVHDSIFAREEIPQKVREIVRTAFIEADRETEALIHDVEVRPTLNNAIVVKETTKKKAREKDQNASSISAMSRCLGEEIQPVDGVPDLA